ncbi:MAG TPA: LLM class flavin-dependent oxidoreductase [Streptosporangiaceae bacterium]|nr:LLM class flavin-dependent oxidoreductase [Streptosporangiaceae bacterium]
MIPLRIGIHSDLREHGEQASIYRQALDLFTLAEELGFDTAWVRSYHFRRRSGTPGFSFPGGLPSPFTFLGALAARTTRIRLGTSVVPLPLENVVRVAEDAAVLDAISGGRLELGVSNGGQPPIAAALGITLDPDPARKKAAYLQTLGNLGRILDGLPVNGTEQELNPPAPGLADRIWESALTEQTGRDSAGRGNGVLIGTTQTVPAEVTAAAYHDCLPADAVPRVGLVVHVHPAVNRRTALAELADDVETVYAWGKDWLPPAVTLADKAAAINVHYGTPNQIAESISAFPAFPHATELQFSVSYGTIEHSQRLAAMELIADEIAPLLGWKPAGPPLA